jgi:hypothetical protein
MKTMTRASARSFLMPIRSAENMKYAHTSDEMIDDQVSKIRVRGENFVGNSSLGLVKKGNGI